jgi:mRNA interferase HicA
VKKRDLERHLSSHGCALARQAAKHEFWQNTATGARTTVPRHREIKTATARGICRQLGIPLPSGPR